MNSAKERTSGDRDVESEDTLGDQALEAIVRSQQLRERSRKLRAKRDENHSSSEKESDS